MPNSAGQTSPENLDLPKGLAQEVRSLAMMILLRMAIKISPENDDDIIRMVHDYTQARINAEGMHDQRRR